MQEDTPNLPFVTPDVLRRVFSEELMESAREQMQRYQRLMAYYRCAMMEIETKLNVLNEEFSLRHDRNPISDIKSRIKHPESIREKLLAYLSIQAQAQKSRYFEIPLGRVELAEYLCVDRSALTRELVKMQEEGIIDYDKNIFRVL